MSVGVTVDSYVVYFERLKDEIRTGKTVRSSLDSGFKRAFRTILAADLVSLLGAVILYWLASGGVRGFAFFLGLSTVIDLVLAYVYMYPLVALDGAATEPGPHEGRRHRRRPRRSRGAGMNERRASRVSRLAASGARAARRQRRQERTS